MLISIHTTAGPHSTTLSAGRTRATAASRGSVRRCILHHRARRFGSGPRAAVREQLLSPLGRKKDSGSSPTAPTLDCRPRVTAGVNAAATRYGDERYEGRCCARLGMRDACGHERGVELGLLCRRQLLNREGPSGGGCVTKIICMLINTVSFHPTPSRMGGHLMSSVPTGTKEKLVWMGTYCYNYCSANLTELCHIHQVAITRRVVAYCRGYRLLSD